MHRFECSGYVHFIHQVVIHILCYQFPRDSDQWPTFSASAQYFAALLVRNFLPIMIMSKKTLEAAMPTKAAEMKQFWYPRFVIQGVMLTLMLARENLEDIHAKDLPI